VRRYFSKMTRIIQPGRRWRAWFAQLFIIFPLHGMPLNIVVIVAASGHLNISDPLCDQLGIRTESRLHHGQRIG
jgi:hypothetical protein